MMTSMPISAIRKRYSAMVSKYFSLFKFDVLMEIKEKILENVRNTATPDVNSSITCISI